MRHRKDRKRICRDTSHQRCLVANMLKSLVQNETIETTVTKAKFLKSCADKLITLAKTNTLASRRRAIQQLMIRFNSLTPKEQRAAKNDKDFSSYNGDRLVIKKLFEELGPRFEERQGGYTRVVRHTIRRGDSVQKCILSYVD